MLAQIREIASYSVTGFWLDILRFPERFRAGCFCDHCQRKYRIRTGRTAPAMLDPHSPAARDYVRFLEDSVTSFLRDARVAAAGKTISFNGAGFLTPRAWNELCDWHNVEGHAPEFDDQSFKCRYLASLGKPWEVLTPANYEGWTSFSAKPVDTMQLEQAIAFAQGGVMTFGISPGANGNATEPGTTIESQRRALAVVNKRHQALHRWVDGGRPVANITILHTLATHGAMVGGHPNPGLDQDVFRAVLSGQQADGYMREVILDAKGYHRAMIDRGFQYRVTNEFGLFNLADTHTLMLADQRYLPGEAIDALGEFVKTGGSLILSGQTSLFDGEGGRRDDFLLADLAGVHWRDVSEYSVNYVTADDDALSTGLADRHVPIMVPCQIIGTDEETEVLARLTFPESERSEGRFFFHEHSGPDLTNDRHPPLVTRRAYGSGAVYYLAAPLGREFYLRQDPSIGQLLRNIVAHCTPAVVRTRAGVGLEIAVTTHSEPRRVLVHLVNHYTDRCEAFLAARKARDVDLSIDAAWIGTALGGEPDRAQLVPDQRQVPFQVRDGRVELTVDQIEISAVVALERS